MVVVHEPAWPDKIMTSAMLGVMSGLLAIGHAIITAAGASLGDIRPAGILEDIPLGWAVIAGGLAFVAGIVGYLYQAWWPTFLALVAGMVSFGLFGAATVVALLGVWPLVRSSMEGEETRLDRHRVHARHWPDKAIMGSVSLASAGAVALVQAVLLLMDEMNAPLVQGQPMLWAAWSAVGAAVMLTGARDAFHLRRAWSPWAASVAAVATFGFYVVGPLLGVITMAYLLLAERESEFTASQA